jgi:hypothetical protein
MILIYLTLGSLMMFLSGAFWTSYEVNKIEDKPFAKLLVWSIGLSLFGLYMLISMIGFIK